MGLGLLIDFIPAAQRKIVYAVLTVAVAIYGAWQAFDGDWGQFIVSLVTALVTALATANTNVQASVKGEATLPTVEDRVEAGENPDQTGVLPGGKHAAPEESYAVDETEPPRYYS